jgi:phosphoglycolate phosphatase-like HAD superfamily hydrolase
MLRSVLDAEDAIDEATFCGDVDASKPAPDLVEVALDKAGVPAEDAVFVGDTVWDVQACRKASVPCIGVLRGGFSRDELTEAAPLRSTPARPNCWPPCRRACSAGYVRSGAARSSSSG